jgi:hypothetical protein
MEDSMSGKPEKTLVFRDRGRIRFSLALVGGFVLLGLLFAFDLDGVTDRLVVVALASSLAALCALPIRLRVEAGVHGIKLQSYFRNRSIAWTEIAYFGLERMPGRLTSVPVVVLQSGRKFAMYGLDSAFSGFGASSPLWGTAISALNQELSRRRMARWE